MNKDRRARINGLRNQLDRVSNVIDDLIDEESNAMAGVPESLQESERYQKMEEAIDHMKQEISIMDS